MQLGHGEWVQLALYPIPILVMNDELDGALNDKWLQKMLLHKLSLLIMHKKIKINLKTGPICRHIF